VVQVTRSKHAPVHGTEDLDISDRVEAKPPRDTLRDHLDQLRETLFGLGNLQDIEIARFPCPRGLRHLSGIDPMGVDNDAALGGLSEYLG
jgi:hypothetical protein